MFDSGEGVAATGPLMITFPPGDVVVAVVIGIDLDSIVVEGAADDEVDLVAASGIAVAAAERLEFRARLLVFAATTWTVLEAL